MTDAERRKKTEEELFLLFNLLTRDTRHNLVQIVADYYAGRVSLWQLSDAFITALRDAHSHASYLGRRLAGNRAPFGRGDQDFAAGVVIGQSRYLEGLVVAIQTGQYVATADGGVPVDLVRRLSAYARVLRGTANEAWGLNLPEDTMIDWVLGPLEHCTPQAGFPYSCVQLADGGPYPVREMPTWPGMGDTPCIYNCGCNTRTQNGQTGFPFVDLSE